MFVFLIFFGLGGTEKYAVVFSFLVGRIGLLLGVQTQNVIRVILQFFLRHVAKT